MPFPNQDYNNRDYLLPAGCTDLRDAIKRQEKTAPGPIPDPPITRHVTLPEKVAVHFLADATRQTVDTIATLMIQLHICVSIQRSLDFDDAAKILRKFGIGAERPA